MGGAKYIFIDKTGTLTEYQMYIISLITNNKEINIKRNIYSIEVRNINSIPMDIILWKKIRSNYNMNVDNEKYYEILHMSISTNADCEITSLIKLDIKGDMETCSARNKADKTFVEFSYRFKSPVTIYRNKILSNNYNYKKLLFDSFKKKNIYFNKKFIFSHKIWTFYKRGGRK